MRDIRKQGENSQLTNITNGKDNIFVDSANVRDNIKILWATLSFN